MRCMPVLMYHHVSPNKGDMITVTPEAFEGQLRHIKDAGYRAVGADELLAFMEGGISAEKKCVALTFDDGYLDNYLFAFPLLKAYGIKAIIFVVTNWVEAASGVDATAKMAAKEECLKRAPTHAECKRFIKEGMSHRAVLDWSMLKEMAGSGLVEVYSHTATHRSCDKLTRDEVAEELKDSRAAIMERLKMNPEHLCWPKGRFSTIALEAAVELGFRSIFTTEPGVVKKGDDPKRIKRIVVKEGAAWLKKRLRIYTNPILSDLYIKVKGYS